MDLAVKDVQRHLGKFGATIVGVGFLLAIVLIMNGIYQGNIGDGVWLIENTRADLWVVERHRGGSCCTGRNRKPMRLPSTSCGRAFSSARQAALRPAASPSKQNTTWSVRRSNFCTW